MITASHKQKSGQQKVVAGEKNDMKVFYSWL